MEYKQKLVLGFAITLSVVCCISMILAIVGYSNSTSGSEILKDLYNNHRKPMYNNVLIGSSQCRNGVEHSFSQAYYEGTDDGCYCNSWSISKGTCSSTSRKKGCYTVSYTDPKYLPVWKNTYDICLNPEFNFLQKKENMTFLDRLLGVDSTMSTYETILRKYGSNTGNCPADTRSCGILDSLGNILCYPNAKPCPMNDILVDRESSFTKPGYQKISLRSSADEKIFFTNNDPKGAIVVEMRASEGKMCMDPYYYEGTGNGYSLDNYLFNRVGSCPDNDKKIARYNKFYKFVDSNSKFNTYDDNGVLTLLKRLPNYPISGLTNKQFNLYYRNYIGWSRECLVDKNYAPSLMDAYYELATSNSSLHYATMVISIIAFCFSLCTFGGMVEKAEICFNIIGIVPWALCLTCGILMSKVQSVMVPAYLIACMENEMQNLIIYANDSINKGDWYSTTLMVFNYGVVIFLVVTCYFICCKNDDGSSNTYIYDDTNDKSGGFINPSNDAIDTHNMNNNSYNNYNNNNNNFNNYNNPYNNTGNNFNYNNNNNNNNFNSGGGFIPASNDAFDTKNNFNNSGGFIPASNDAFDSKKLDYNRYSSTEFPGSNSNMDNVNNMNNMNHNDNFNNNFNSNTGNNNRYN